MTLRALGGIASISTAFVCGLVSAAPVGEAEVKQCVEDILQRSGGVCLNAVSLTSVKKVDARVTANEAVVIADVYLRVKQRMGAKSQGAAQCTGTAWLVDTPKNPYAPNTGAWLMFQSQSDMDGGYLEPGQELRIRKNFRFEQWESGWRCAETQMNPVDKGWLEKAGASPAAPGGQPRPDTAGYLPVDAGGCRVFAPKTQAETYKLKWDGQCSDGYAQGEGVLRLYDPSGRLASITKGQMFQGNHRNVDRYFRQSTGGQLTHFTSGKSSSDLIGPSDVPVWAREIAQ